MVPALLLLVARDLLLYDPPRVLAWRVLHDPGLQALPPGLGWLLPSGNPFDRDPVALVLAAIASGLAVAYLAAALAGAAARWRWGIVGAAGLALLVAPSAAFIAMGTATQRPYGQDGGVVQLPLAIDKILAGDSPYAADYSDSILGKQARVSGFWDEHGGNPILRHHAYLPGTHLLMLPAQLLSKWTLGAFDPRLLTLPACLLAAWLAALLARAGAGHALAAAALVIANPLVYWQQVFGANDVLVAALLLAAVLGARRGQPFAAAALLGLACAVKQLAWPYAPFLLAQLSGARSLRQLLSRPGLGRLARPAAVALGVFAVAVGPVACLDLRAFWADIVLYNAGLGPGDNYPLGGTPGFGFANYLIYFGRVASLRDHVPLGAFYLLLVPLGLLLLRHQLRDGRAATALVTGSAALLLSLYVSRVVHPNYLVLAAMLLPIGVLAGARVAPHAVVVPLLLLSLAVEVAEQQTLRAVWEDALAVRLPQHLQGVSAALAPRAGPSLTQDPLGLVQSATAAGLGIAWLWAGVLGARRRLYVALGAAAFVAVVAVPAFVVTRIGAASGQPRVQDTWGASAVDAAREARGSSRALPAREAWSASFRRDAPRAVMADASRPPIGARLAGALTSALGLADPRLLSLAAALLAALLAARLAPGSAPALVLAPATISALVFGAPDVMLLALAVAVLVRARGLADRRARAVLLAACGLCLLAVWIGAADPAPAPGLGLPNLLLYHGAGASAGFTLGLGLLVLAGSATILLRVPGPAGLALVLLAVAWVWPGISPHALVVPLGLVLIAAFEPSRSSPPASL